jgi:hypothetical protein
VKSVINFLVVALLVVSAAGRALAQAPRASDLDLVARYTNESAVGVIRINMQRIDTDAVINDLARTFSDALREKDPALLGTTDADFQKARESAHEWRKKFEAAGGREVYIIVAFNPAVDSPLIGIVPTEEGAKASELIELMKDFPVPVGRYGRAAEGAVVTGPGALTTGMPLSEPTRRGEIDRELKRAGDAPIQLALIPADFVRRAIEENVATLPDELGGGPSTVLTKGVVSGSGSISLAPEWSARIVLQSESEAAAAALAAAIKKGVETLTLRAGPELGPELAKALTPRAEGSVVVVALGEERIASLKKALVPSLMQARKAAKRAVTASNMRQGIVGCLTYAQDHNDEWPKDLQTLVAEGDIQEAQLHNPQRPELYPAFEYIRPDSAVLQKSEWQRHMVIYEKFDAWPEQGIWAGFADGHLEIVQDEAKFKELLEFAKKNAAK